MQFILASSALHRSKILSEFGIKHILKSPNIIEKWNYNIKCEDNTKMLALQKAKVVQKEYPLGIIISADTSIINSQKEIYFKPKSLKEAQEYLKKRSNNYEDIITGFCIAYKNQYILDTDCTRVYYKKISKEEQKKLLETNEWRKVCGGLRIEGSIQKYVDKIEGSYENIIGLPIQKIKLSLEKIILK